jgi:hypothetical protein
MDRGIVTWAAVGTAMSVGIVIGIVSPDDIAPYAEAQPTLGAAGLRAADAAQVGQQTLSFAPASQPERARRRTRPSPVHVVVDRTPTGAPAAPTTPSVVAPTDDSDDVPDPSQDPVPPPAPDGNAADRAPDDGAADDGNAGDGDASGPLSALLNPVDELIEQLPPPPVPAPVSPAPVSPVLESTLPV